MRLTQRKQPGHSIDLVFSLVLFLLFSITGIGVVLIGSQVYSSCAAQLEETYTSRTALSYVSEKVRQADVSGAVELVNPSGFPENALVIHETVDGGSYNTFIYFYDGALRELLVKEGTEITPQQGTAIVSLRSFTIEKRGTNFYILSATEKSGKVNQLMIHPKSM